MKHQLLRSFIVLALVFGATILVGCYTQLGTVRSSGDPGYTGDNTEQGDRGYEAYEDSTAPQDSEGYYDDYWYNRNRVGFSYYYPTVFIGAGFYDPWYYSRFGWYSYYDPFLCGTADPWIYAGGYYPPYWYNYPGYYGGFYRYPYSGGGRIHGATRTFGNTRGGGGIRTVSGGGGVNSLYQTPARGNDLPVGYRANTTSGRTGASPSVAPKVSTGKRGGEATRGGSRSGKSAGRGGNTRGGSGKTHIYHPSTPPAGPPSSPRGNSGGQRSGGEGRSYSPPHSQPSSAPSSPPSSGGGSPSNSGARGGNRR